MSQVKSLETGEKFKNTPIGKIPVDWEVLPLSQVAELNMGQSPLSQDCHDYKDGLPFFQGNADFGPKYPTTRRWCKKPLKLAQKDDILISVRAPVGEINIAPYECCIGRGLGAVRATKINGEYLFQSMLFHRKALEKVSQGSTFEAINRKELSDFLMFAPPLSEQKRIAEILTAVDEVIETTNEVIKKTRELKKGLMQTLITRGIGHAEFKDTPIGKIPVDWSVIPLKELVFLEYGSSLPERERREGTISVYGSNGIVGFHNEKLVDGPGIVIGRKGTVGAISWSEGDFWPIDTTYYISARSFGGDLKWFFYLLSSLHLEILNAATGVPGLNRDTTHSLIVPLPPKDEQKKIAEILSEVDSAIENQAAHKQKFEIMKKALVQVLLTGKVRVKVS